MKQFKYGEKELNYLKSRDKILGEVIDMVGYLPCKLEYDFFPMLVNSIITQQISLKAAESIWQRVLAKFNNSITPEKFLETNDEEIHKLGLSHRKIEYIKNIAANLISGELDIAKLDLMDDNEAMKELMRFRGIGNWTAEMLLIFSLARKDILSYGDLTIIRGLRMLYNLEKIDKNTFEKYKKLYSPYGSIASFYLWYIAVGKLDKTILDEIHRKNNRLKTICEDAKEYMKTCKTRIGNITIVADGDYITAIFLGKDKIPKNIEVKETNIIKKASEEIIQYLDGKLKEFSVPVKPKGTEFQMEVWQALKNIPYGKTRSYRDIAEAIGKPKACRAVGMANGKNPIPIIIPCHRVINKNGTLGGFSCGLEVKKKLLEIEKNTTIF